jgi:hypothetical protein
MYHQARHEGTYQRTQYGKYHNRRPPTLELRLGDGKRRLKYYGREKHGHEQIIIKRQGVNTGIGQ